MAFAIVIIVLMVTSQVYSHPRVLTKEQNTIADRLSVGPEGLEFKLPTAVTHNFEIKVNGTLNRKDNTFSVLLPQVGTADPCSIVHDFENNKIQVSPVALDRVETQNYVIRTNYIETNFILTLTARAEVNQNIFEVVYEAVDNGPMRELGCKVNFEDVGYIIFKKGVQRINSILFMFL